ncbi:hypothetical protein FGG08_003864 [Glutinoglossum americanum]|uniref:Uncharacterized protein n=1 Tax=Glutinoglossum americanum TaxID=1670608 RepID=A0A9P8I6G5_9PEZI|nr:hypothetical protein FGG08_003864 [Glutinoglossum americanum]
MAAQSQLNLSNNDALVLSLVFDPESSGPFSSILIDPTCPPSLPHISADLLRILQFTELTAIQPLNIPAPSPSLIQHALAQLTDLVTAHPTYASAYNNRAQALRLLLGDDLRSEAVQRSTLWSDLCKAIALATPAAVGARVSALQGNVLSAAHAQRGHLLWKAANSFGDNYGLEVGGDRGKGEKWEEKCSGQLLPEPLRGIGRAGLEEMANLDFEIAGRYGDRGARKVAASTNPYARLCGDIVKEAMRAEIEGNSLLRGSPRLL